MGTIKIKFCDIPSFLRGGEFYRSLDSSDTEGFIEIPENCYPLQEQSAENLDEFRQLLRVIEFWVLDDIPFGVLNYCSQHEVGSWTDGFADVPATKVVFGPLLLTAFSKQNSFPLTDIFMANRWELIEYVVGRIDQSDASVTAVAAYCGHLRLLKYLHKLGFAWDEKTCSNASKHGYLGCLQYAHENGCPWDRYVYVEAAENGHLNCIKYAHEQGLHEWHENVCKYAAENGHLNCLRYALEHGCPVDKIACYDAASKGHLECLQLLHEYGAPWDEGTANGAAVAPDSACLQYLYDNGCPWDIYTTGRAAGIGCIATLKFAMDQGCPYVGATVDDEECKRIDNPEFLSCVVYAVERGWTPNERFIEYMAGRDRQCKEWLELQLF